MTRSDNTPWIVTAVIAAIGVAYAVMECHMVSIGDDAGYRQTWLMSSRAEDFLRWALGHWVGSNGRLPNFIAPPFLSLPRWVIAPVEGMAIASWLWLMVRLCRFRPRQTTLQLALIAVVALTFPWWDSTMQDIVLLNYVWAIALGLLFARIWLYGPAPRRWRWGLYAMSLCAGMMHEAMSLPLMCALVVWIVAGRRWAQIDGVRRWMLLWFAIGLAEVLLSPSLWMRFVSVNASAAVPDDPMWLLTLKSDAWVLVMLVVIAVMAIVARPRLKALASTPLSVWAVAAVASMCISAIGGVVGRSGWFASTYALIVLFGLAATIDVRINRRAAVALSALLIALLGVHYVGLVAAQIRLGSELKRAVDMYSRSSDGIVYLDYTPDDRLPWWLLHKQRGVPDNDDLFILESIANSYGDSSRLPMVILPVAAQGIDARSLDSDTTFAAGTITPLLPPTNSLGLFMRGDTLMIARRFVLDGTPLYFVTPVDADPGDRYRL